MFDFDFSGIGKETIALIAEAAIVVGDEGKVVKVGAEKTGALCSAEDVFYGPIEKFEDGNTVLDNALTVQRAGLAEVTYTGVPALGWTELVADGNGGVKPPAVAGSGRFCSVLSIDATAGTLWLDLG